MELGCSHNLPVIDLMLEDFVSYSMEKGVDVVEEELEDRIYELERTIYWYEILLTGIRMKKSKEKWFNQDRGKEIEEMDKN